MPHRLRPSQRHGDRRRRSADGRAAACGGVPDSECCEAVLECCELPDCGAAALGRCNLVLVVIAESWRQMDGVPFRCSIEHSTRRRICKLSFQRNDSAVRRHRRKDCRQTVV